MCPRVNQPWLQRVADSARCFYVWLDREVEDCRGCAWHLSAQLGVGLSILMRCLMSDARAKHAIKERHLAAARERGQSQGTFVARAR